MSSQNLSPSHSPALNIRVGRRRSATIAMSSSAARLRRRIRRPSTRSSKACLQVPGALGDARVRTMMSIDLTENIPMREPAPDLDFHVRMAPDDAHQIIHELAL